MKTSESMNNIKLGKNFLNNKKSNICVNKVKSTKNIYIQESKKKNESPIYRKKNMNNNKINEYYFFSSDKRVKIKNKKENEGDNNISNIFGNINNRIRLNI